MPAIVLSTQRDHTMSLTANQDETTASTRACAREELAETKVKRVEDEEVVVVTAAVADSRECTDRGRSVRAPISLAQAAMEMNDSTKLLLLAVLLCSFSMTCYLSTFVAAEENTFPTGRLTPVQMSCFTLSFATLICSTIWGRLWPDAASAPFASYISAWSDIALALLLIFFCDRTAIIPRRNKVFNKDFFSLAVMGFAMAGACTIRTIPRREPAPAAKPAAAAEARGENGVRNPSEGQSAALLAPAVAPPVLSEANMLMNRYQTDEWKGWMQMLFLWYHYFHHRELYNVIRIFIAAYVWMTGFGNFTYYYKRKDFSLHRFLSMMWRLNMFVVLVCALMRNEYMLYYICPLHTFFTLTVYVMLLIKHNLNTNGTVLVTKFVLTTALCFVLWDAPFSKSLFRIAFSPLKALVRYDDPYRPGRDIYSEWFFRSFLDHYIWIVGMLVAYYYKHADSWLRKLDDCGHGSGRARAIAIKWAIGAIASGAMAIHYYTIMLRPKMEYNAIHPYTSVVPVIAFLTLRNLSQRVRAMYIGLFEWLGKVTLETYICQYHIWMATTGINGSPHQLLRIIPGDYPMCDFFFGNLIMIYVSYRVGRATDVTKKMMFPEHASPRVLCVNLITAAAVWAGLIGAHAAWLAVAPQ